MNYSAPVEDPLSEWLAAFKRNTLTLHQLMILRTSKDDEQKRNEMYPKMQRIADAIAELERDMRNLKRHVAEERSQLAQLQDFRHALEFQKERVALINKQIPDEVAQNLGIAEESNGIDKENLELDHVEEERIERVEKVESVKKKPPSGSGKAVGVKTQVKATVKEGGRKIGNNRKDSHAGIDVPVIRSVSQEELDDAPQYVKGRLTLVKIDKVTESLNKIAADKYRLMAKSYRDLSHMDKNTYQDLRDNECDETQGKPFLTDAEIKGFGAYRLDSTAKSVINVLRHVGALKQVRGKKNTNMLLINCD